MVKIEYNSLKIERPNMPIIAFLHVVLSDNSNFREQCMGFYNIMRAWLEMARGNETLIIIKNRIKRYCIVFYIYIIFKLLFLC